MTTADQGRGARTVARRTLAGGVAWAVPVIAVGAAAPAFAASGGTGGITAVCGAGTLATYTLDVTGSNSPQMEVLFSRVGSGTFSVSTPATWVLSGSTLTTVTYLVPVVSGTATGSATVSFQLPQNGTSSITATISATSGQPITGDTSVTVTKSRSGNSANYSCSVT